MLNFLQPFLDKYFDILVLRIVIYKTNKGIKDLIASHQAKITWTASSKFGTYRICE